MHDLFAYFNGALTLAVAGAAVYANVLFVDKSIDFFALKYNEYKSNNEKETVNSEELDIPYEYKYLDDYNIKVSNSHSSNAEDYNKDDKINKSYVKIHETTPKGDVIMYYDNNLESFVYYCDDKNIPYKYLETVARKFVLDNDCISLYVNMYEEIKKGIERKELESSREKEITQNGTTNCDSAVNSVFATFKTYNLTNEKLRLKTKHYVLKEQSNRYSYRGKIKDGEKLTINTDVSPCNDSDNLPPPPPTQSKVVSFAEFKTMQQKDKLTLNTFLPDSHKKHDNIVKENSSSSIETSSDSDDSDDSNTKEIVATESQIHELFG